MFELLRLAGVIVVASITSALEAVMQCRANATAPRRDTLQSVRASVFHKDIQALAQRNRVTVPTRLCRNRGTGRPSQLPHKFNASAAIGTPTSMLQQLIDLMPRKAIILEKCSGTNPCRILACSLYGASLLLHLPHSTFSPLRRSKRSWRHWPGDKRSWQPRPGHESALQTRSAAEMSHQLCDLVSAVSHLQVQNRRDGESDLQALSQRANIVNAVSPHHSLSTPHPRLR
mmetsp:Transcript_750/g.1468  ORF Transcript_750/g.1468 Transcript_750/m.1468 type:complete len:230 (-) Transcript_750:181-870(-)